jgi:hypothetical protein
VLIRQQASTKPAFLRGYLRSHRRIPFIYLLTFYIKLFNNNCILLGLITKPRQCANHHIPLCAAKKSKETA